VYKTAEQTKLKCTQQVCEQKIDLDGSSISLNGYSNVLCNSETRAQTTIIATKPNQQTSKVIPLEISNSISNGNKITLVAITSFILLGLSVIILFVYWYMRRQNKLNLEKLKFMRNKKQV
jgi:hypothetical protein